MDLVWVIALLIASVVATALGVPWSLKRRKVLPPPPPLAVAAVAPPPAVDPEDAPIHDDEFVLALAEQVRRESLNPVAYRRDQRILAIQQRLSRKYGPRAWTNNTLERLKIALERHEHFGKQ